MSTILIVDQSAFQRKRLCNIIKDLGMTVAGELSSIETLVELYHSSNPDLVIMSVSSSSKETNDAIKAIVNYNQQAKIIVCSHLRFQDDVQEYLNSGAKDFILKPYKIEEIERACSLMGF